MNALLLLAIWMASSAASPAPPQSTVLGVGSPVDRSIAAGESQTFDLKLDAGQAALVEIEADGIDVELRVTEPNGDTIAQFTDLFGGQGRGQMAVAADTAGPLVLTVSARRWPIASGSYTLRLTGLRQIAPSDRERLRAMRLRAEVGRAEDAAQPRAGDRAGGRGTGGRRSRSEPVRQRARAYSPTTSLGCTTTEPSDRRRGRCTSGACPSSNDRSVPIILGWRGALSTRGHPDR